MQLFSDLNSTSLQDIFTQASKMTQHDALSQLDSLASRLSQGGVLGSADWLTLAVVGAYLMAPHERMNELRTKREEELQRENQSIFRTPDISL